MKNSKRRVLISNALFFFIEFLSNQAADPSVVIVSLLIEVGMPLKALTLWLQQSYLLC